ncbi:hypothetical protein [Weissella paramesenteroides]|uniref:hypothetical protein n=1 Tax=Weissella paramesenteroides TaxID=1249 RepID=UPI003D35F8F1
MKDTTKKKIIEETNDIGTASFDGILSIIPVIGSPVQTALSSYFNNRRLRNIEKFNAKLEADLLAVKSQIPDIKYIERDEVIDIVETVYDEIATSKAREKLSYYSKALTNSFINSEKSSLQQERFFTEALIAIPTPYISILSSLLPFDERNATNEQDTDNKFSNSIDIIRGSNSFLEGYGFIEQKYDKARTKANMHLQAYSILGSAGAPLVEPSYYFRITSLGIDFMRFIKKYKNKD